MIHRADHIVIEYLMALKCDVIWRNEHRMHMIDSYTPCNFVRIQAILWDIKSCDFVGSHVIYLAAPCYLFEIRWFCWISCDFFGCTMWFFFNQVILLDLMWIWKLPCTRCRSCLPFRVSSATLSQPSPYRKVQQKPSIHFIWRKHQYISSDGEGSPGGGEKRCIYEM